jgi:predicted nuclease of predicted toxin-antitoxin system
MSRTIRFHLDQHIPNAIAEGLRRRGIDVTTTSEAGLLHATDFEHIEYAMRTRRVILTHDEDYLIHAANSVPHAGIVFCHMGSRTIGEIVHSLVMIWEIAEPAALQDTIEWI